MNLEEKISELRKKLALKEAYLSVKFTFPKGNKIPEEIKKQVTNELKKACTQLAEHEDYTLDDNENTSQASLFTSREANILKEVAASVYKKAMGETAPESTAKKIKEETPVNTAKNTARILMLDSVDKTIRNKVEPQCEVKVVASGDGKHFVETRDNDRRRFWINTEDLDFNI